MIARMSRRARQRLASILGVAPLFAFLVFHAWETSAALLGRAAFGARFGTTTESSTAFFIKGLVCIQPLLVHAFLSLTTPSEGDDILLRYRTPGVLRLQQLTGVVTLAYLIWHLAVVWFPMWTGSTAADAYDEMMALEGKPVRFVVHAIGLAAVAFHCAVGGAAACVTFGVARSEEGLRRARIVFGALALALYLVFLNNLAHFVVGQAFVGDSDSVHESVRDGVE